MEQKSYQQPNQKMIKQFLFILTILSFHGAFHAFHEILHDKSIKTTKAYISSYTLGTSFTNSPITRRWMNRNILKTMKRRAIKGLLWQGDKVIVRFYNNPTQEEYDIYVKCLSTQLSGIMEYKITFTDYILISLKHGSFTRDQFQIFLDKINASIEDNGDKELNVLNQEHF
ncbi:MAG: hypothetical protein WC747_01590 [Candidatus Babeliales bacterium]|jgi:hypothetical protein